MSLENHPNFHAVKFTTAIMIAFYESLRGKTNKDNVPEITDEVLEFVQKIEEKIDMAVE